jgi:hypothetical protein
VRDPSRDDETRGCYTARLPSEKPHRASGVKNPAMEKRVTMGTPMEKIMHRFKVTTPNNGTVYIVYGRDEAEALGRLPASLPIERVERAGYSVDGVLHVPPEEVAAAMASTRDDRVAPLA